MPIDPIELVEFESKLDPTLDLAQEPRKITNLAQADFNVEAAGFKDKILKPLGQSLRYYMTIFGLPIIIFAIGYSYRQGIMEVIESVRPQIKMMPTEEQRLIDPRVIEKFGEEYEKEAKTEGGGQYSLYLLGSVDNHFDLTNIPKLNEKDNTVWYFTDQYGITWPFVTKEKGEKILDPDLFPIADRQVFINNISEDLGLSVEQKIDLELKYKSLSEDPRVVLQWLNDLQKQGVKKITDEVIKYYTDPVGFVTGLTN